MSNLRVSRLPSALGGVGIYSGAGAPSNGTNAIQTLTFGSGITGGTFKLRFKNQVTASISWSATNNTLRDNIDAALEALSGIGTGGVTTAVGTMTAGIGTMTVAFTTLNAAKPVPLMTVEVNALTGTTHVLTIATTTPGVEATARGAATGAEYVNTTNGTHYINTGTPNQPVWTSGPIIADVTATATEINELAGVTPGAVSASKALVSDANKDVAGVRFFPTSGGSLAATGSDQAGAAPIVTEAVKATGADGAKGIKLPAAVAGQRIFVVNTDGSNALLVYPATGGKINGGTTNASISAAASAKIAFWAVSSTEWYSHVSA